MKLINKNYVKLCLCTIFALPILQRSENTHEYTEIQECELEGQIKG